MLNDNDTAIITPDAKVLMRHRHFLYSVNLYTGSNTATCDTICDMLCSKKPDLMLLKGKHTARSLLQNKHQKCRYDGVYFTILTVRYAVNYTVPYKIHNNNKI